MIQTSEHSRKQAFLIILITLFIAACVKEEAGKQNNQAASIDRKSTRLNSSHLDLSRMPSSA